MWDVFDKLLVFIRVCVKHDFVQLLKLNMVLEIGEWSSFQWHKICNIYKFLKTHSLLLIYVPKGKALSASALCTTYFEGNSFPTATSCFCLAYAVFVSWHSDDACSFTDNFLKSTLLFMNVMSDDGFLRSILSFLEIQTLQIIAFCSLITSHSCFFQYFNVEAFGSSRIRWVAELSTSEVDPDDRTLSGALATTYTLPKYLLNY